MGQRKYLIFSTGGRCQWLMKRWNRFSLFFFKIISLSSSEMIFYQVVRIPTFRWITCYKWSGHQDLRRRCSEIMIFRSARTSCRTFDFSTRPVRDNFSWVQRWAVTLPSGLRYPSNHIFSESWWCQRSKFGRKYKYKDKYRGKYKYRDK